MGIFSFAVWIVQRSFHFLMVNGQCVQSGNTFLNFVILGRCFVFSRLAEEHWDHHRQALQWIKGAKLYGRLHKCEFLKAQLDFLAFEVPAARVHDLLEKRKAMVEWPRPSQHYVHLF